MGFELSDELKVWNILCWIWAAIVVMSMVASFVMTVPIETALDRGAGCYWSDHLLLEIKCVEEGTLLKSFLSLWLVVLLLQLELWNPDVDALYGFVAYAYSTTDNEEITVSGELGGNTYILNVFLQAGDDDATPGNSYDLDIAVAIP